MSVASYWLPTIPSSAPGHLAAMPSSPSWNLRWLQTASSHRPSSGPERYSPTPARCWEMGPHHLPFGQSFSYQSLHSSNWRRHVGSSSGAFLNYLSHLVWEERRTIPFTWERGEEKARVFQFLKENVSQFFNPCAYTYSSWVDLRSQNQFDPSLQVLHWWYSPSL